MMLLFVGITTISAQENALNFEGPVNSTYDYIEVPDDASLDFTTSFTFETWVNFDHITRFSDGWDWECLFAKSRYTESYGLMLLTEGTKILRFYHNGFGTGHTDYNWTGSLIANTWYHIAVTFNGTKTAIYINGSEVASQTAASGSVNPNNNPLQIGAGSTGGGDPYPLDGTLEETRLWNYARSEAEIKGSMNSELTGSESGLVLYYKYNQGTAGGNNTSITEVMDSSASGNNGTLKQFDLNGTLSNFIDAVENQTITFDALSDVTYGNANFNLTATASSGLEVAYTSSNTSVATISGNTVTIVGAGTTTITASQAGNTIFNGAIDVPQTLTVNTLPIEITADAKNKYVGAVDPEFTYTITSGALINGDTFSGSLSRVSGEMAGSYAINLGTLSNENYNISFVSNNLTILNPLAITWDGSTSADWAEETNWDGGVVPSSGSDITIPNVAVSPLIAAATNAEINNLTLNSSSSLNIEGSLIVNVDFDNNGTVTMTSSVNNSSSLLIKGASNGMVTYQRGGLVANKWSIIVAPVSGQSIKDFVENPANDIHLNTSVTPNRYAIAYYDDSKPTGSKWVYYTTDDLATNTLTFEKGRGYAISRVTNGSVTFTGTVETTDVAKSIVASEWNAIGNPYTAFLPINENAGTNFINGNVSKFNPANVGVYVWDNVQAKYLGKSLITEESFLAPGQGFFVKAAAGVSNVTFNQSQRKVQPLTGGNFSKGGAVVPNIQLLATSKGVTIDTNIKYFENATEGLDPGYDLGNYARATFDVFTRFVGNDKEEDFTIQSLPVESIDRTVLPIGLSATAGAEVRFTVNYNNLPEGVEVFIEDKEENTFTKLSSELNEFYTVTITEKVNGVGRFYLHTQQKAKINTNINNVKIYNTSGNTLIIEGISKGTFDMTLYAIHGAAVLSKTVEGKGRNTISLPDLETGVYVVRITSELGKKSKKIIIKK